MQYPRKPTLDQTPASVLIVDDEPVVRLVLRELLQEDRYEIVEAESSARALELVRERTFDLVITDKNLPGMDGIRLIEAALELRPELHFIMITGYPSLISARRALELGICCYLTKPFDDAREVRQKVRAALTLSEEPVAPPLEGPLTVLVYEADPVYADALVAALRRSGHHPQIANDVEHAKAAHTEKYDAAIVSWEACGGTNELWQIRSLVRNRRLILLTDEVSFEKTVAAIALGAKACLPRHALQLEQLPQELQKAL